MPVERTAGCLPLRLTDVNPVTMLSLSRLIEFVSGVMTLEVRTVSAPRSMSKRLAGSLLGSCLYIFHRRATFSSPVRLNPIALLYSAYLKLT